MISKIDLFIHVRLFLRYFQSKSNAFLCWLWANFSQVICYDLSYIVRHPTAFVCFIFICSSVKRFLIKNLQNAPNEILHLKGKKVNMLTQLRNSEL